MIQLGSILAVMWLYRAKIVAVDRRSRIDAGGPSLCDCDRRWPRFRRCWLARCSPATSNRVLYESPRVFAVAFIAGGIVMLIVERFRPAPTCSMPNRHPLPRALGIGLCQTLALIPGVSRSGATIVGGLVMRLDGPAAAEFSFFLAMPTMTAAFAHELFEVRGQLSPERGAEIASRLRDGVYLFAAHHQAVSGFVRRGRDLRPFAWYRIAIGARR